MDLINFKNILPALGLGSIASRMTDSVESLWIYIFLYLALSILDVITGVVRGFVLGRKFSSRRFQSERRLIKSFVFIVGLLALFILELVFLKMPKTFEIILSYSWISFFCISEVVSILENLNTIAKKRGIQIPIIGKVLDKLSKYIEKEDEEVNDQSNKS